MDFYYYYYYLFVRFYHLLNLVIFDLKNTAFFYFFINFLLIYLTAVFVLFVMFIILVNFIYIKYKEEKKLIIYKNFKRFFIVILLFPFFLMQYFSQNYLIIFIFLVFLVLVKNNLSKIIKFFKFFFQPKIIEFISFTWNIIDKIIIEQVTTFKGKKLKVITPFGEKFELDSKSKMYKNFDALFNINYPFIFSILKYFKIFNFLSIIELKEICDSFVDLYIEYYKIYFKKSYLFIKYLIILIYFLGILCMVIKICLFRNYFSVNFLDLALNNFFNFNISLLYIEFLAKFIFLLLSISIFIIYFFIILGVIIFFCYLLYSHYYKDLVNKEFKDLILNFDIEKLVQILEIKQIYINRENALWVYYFKNEEFFNQKYDLIKSYADKNNFNGIFNDKQKTLTIIEDNIFDGGYFVTINKNIFFLKNAEFFGTIKNKNTTLKHILSFYFLDDYKNIKNNNYLKNKLKLLHEHHKSTPILETLTPPKRFFPMTDSIYSFDSSLFPLWSAVKNISKDKKEDSLEEILKLNHIVPDFFVLLEEFSKKKLFTFLIFNGFFIFYFLIEFLIFLIFHYYKFN
jgi:hypothetical protein